MHDRNGFRVDRTDRTADIARVGSRLAAVAVAPLTVVVLRLFPPLSLSGAGAPAWLAPASTAVAGVAWGVAAVAVLVRGLTGASASRIAEAAAAGTLAAGLSAAAVQAVGGVAAFPGGGLAITALVAATSLLASRLLPTDAGLTRRGRIIGIVLVFAAVEAALAGSLLAVPPAESVPWILASAAAMAAAAAYPAGLLSAGLAAGAFVALGAGRSGTLDAVIPIAALAAAGVAMAYPRGRGSGSDEASEPSSLAPPEAVADAGPMPAPAIAPTLPVDDEALRLARELRGTIEELLQARRTIELQRAEIARAATVDPLTGVASRRAILERLTMEAAEARRYAHPVAVVLLDIDDFHRLNHEHSFAVGDAVLRELALRLRLRMREADALGREGGDSFLAILPHTDERGATVFADAIRRRLTARPVNTDDGELLISVSIGVAFIRPGMTLSDEELLTAAGEALASARAAGGNRIAFDRLHGLARLEERRAPTEGADAADHGG